VPTEKKTERDAIFHLFLRPKDRKAEQWEGSRSGIQAALDVFNADEAVDINKLEKTLPSILKGATKIYTDLPRSFQHKSGFSRYLSGATLRAAAGIADTLKETSGAVVEPLRPMLNKLRVKKSEAEIENMRFAGRASGLAFTDAMKRNFTTEKSLTTFLDYQFKVNGCDGPAYVPVVAGGEVSLSFASRFWVVLTEMAECIEYTLCPERCPIRVRPNSPFTPSLSKNTDSPQS
jgi:intermediate cleaving peptidase 55